MEETWYLTLSYENTITHDTEQTVQPLVGSTTTGTQTPELGAELKIPDKRKVWIIQVRIIEVRLYNHPTALTL